MYRWPRERPRSAGRRRPRPQPPATPAADQAAAEDESAKETEKKWPKRSMRTVTTWPGEGQGLKGRAGLLESDFDQVTTDLLVALTFISTM